jgi:hypothetical protein
MRMHSWMLGASHCYVHFVVKRRFSSCGDISAYKVMLCLHYLLALQQPAVDSLGQYPVNPGRPADWRTASAYRLE